MLYLQIYFFKVLRDDFTLKIMMKCNLQKIHKFIKLYSFLVLWVSVRVERYLYTSNYILINIFV